MSCNGAALGDSRYVKWPETRNGAVIMGAGKLPLASQPPRAEEIRSFNGYGAARAYNSNQFDTAERKRPAV